MATVPAPSVAETTEEDKECENDECHPVNSIITFSVCVDAPNTGNSCDAKRLPVIGTNYCRTYSCGE